MQGKRSYTNLSDLLKDASSPKKLLNDITINGALGYEVINPGLKSQYALLFERPDAIYQLEFSDVPDKESLSTEDKKIIETIKFN